MRVEHIRMLAEAALPAMVLVAANIEAPCGFPSPSQDYQTTEVDLHAELLPHPNMRVMRVRGQSMPAAGIFDGDEIIVDRALAPEDGHVVIAVVDGEPMVKRLHLHRGVVLVDEDPRTPDLRVDELSDLRINGVVVRSIHQLNPTVHRAGGPDLLDPEVDLNRELLGSPGTFLMRTRGHSMTAAGIFDGDEIIVDRTLEARDGNVVVAVVDGEFTVKRLHLLGGGGVVLAAEHPRHPNIRIDELSDLRVWGVVERSLHRVSRG